MTEQYEYASIRVEMASDATLRDKFAMAALPIAWKAKEDGYYEGDDEDVAACAYQMADAMLKARG